MKLNDKIDKVDDNLIIHRYDNGYAVKLSGKKGEDDWADVKIVCKTLDEVIELLKEFSEMEIAD